MNKKSKELGEVKEPSNECSPQKRGELIIAAQQWSAPLPPPKLFQQYESILPGLADRITKMAEGNQKHRIKMESRMLGGDIGSKLLGLILAFLVVLAGMGAGVFLIMNDKPISGFLSMLTPLGIIAGAFYKQKKKKKIS